jgi:hypothetical protein
VSAQVPLKGDTQMSDAERKLMRAVERFVVVNDKGGIAKSTVIQGLSLEMAASGLEHKTIEVEANPRLQRRLGKGRVEYFEFQDGDLDALRRDPDRAGRFWDDVADAFLTGRRLMDMSANATKAFWGWYESGGVGELLFGDGAGVGVLVVTTAEHDSVVLAREAMVRASSEWPAARLYLVVSHHAGELPEGAPVWDRICDGAGKRSGDVTRILLPACKAAVWPVISSWPIPLSEAADFDPHALKGHGFSLGVAARSKSDVGLWLTEWRRGIQKILTTAGLPVAAL